jgi:hypothetical protein
MRSVTCCSTSCAVAPGHSVRTTIALKVNGGSSAGSRVAGGCKHRAVVAIHRRHQLPVAQQMAACGHDPRIRIHAAQQRHRAFGIGTEPDRGEAHASRGRVDHPQRCRLALRVALHRRQRHPQRGALAGLLHVNAGALAQLDRIRGFTFQRHPRSVGAGLRIGSRRDLAHAALQQLAGGAPQLHHHLLAHADVADARFRQRDRDLTPVVACQRVDRLPRGDGLPGFGRARGDHAIARCMQARVGRLVAGQFVLRARGAIRGLLGIEGRLADQFLRHQLAVALQVAADADHFRLRGAGLQGGVARIELGQQLPLADAVADLGEASHQVATDPERERAFIACADVAGIRRRRGVGTRGGMHHQHRARRFRHGRLPAAGGERRQQCHSQHRTHVACALPHDPTPRLVPLLDWSVEYKYRTE